MPREFAAIRTEIWTDPVFMSLSPEARLLYFAAATDPLLTLAGALVFSDARLGAQVCASGKELADFAEELRDAGYLIADHGTGELLVLRGITSQFVGNVKLCKAAYRQAETLRSFDLKQIWFADSPSACDTAEAVLTRLSQIGSNVKESESALHITDYRLQEPNALSIKTGDPSGSGQDCGKLADVYGLMAAEDLKQIGAKVRDPERYRAHRIRVRSLLSADAVVSLIERWPNWPAPRIAAAALAVERNEPYCAVDIYSAEGES
jgi:hypothetical protein